MAALERYFLSKGYAVAGYDRTPSELTGHLQQEGAVIAFDDDVEKAVPQAFRNPADTLVVYTPACHDLFPPGRLRDDKTGRTAG